jgi:hypothetical protein
VDDCDVEQLGVGVQARITLITAMMGGGGTVSCVKVLLIGTLPKHHGKQQNRKRILPSIKVRLSLFEHILDGYTE